MRFAFSDDQILFRDTVRDLLDKECPPEQVRFTWLDSDGRLPGVWAQLAEMGVLGVQIPEVHGGLGLTEEDLVLLLEETGRAALPDPVVDTVAVAAPLLADLAAAGTELAAHWLPRIAAGQAVVAVAGHGDVLVSHGADAELDESAWTKGYQFALSGPIYAGTNEIQRNVIAERVLGMPRR